MCGEILLTRRHQGLRFVGKPGLNHHRRQPEHIGSALILSRHRNLSRDGKAAGKQGGLSVSGSHCSSYAHQRMATIFRAHPLRWQEDVSNNVSPFMRDGRRRLFAGSGNTHGQPACRLCLSFRNRKLSPVPGHGGRPGGPGRRSPWPASRWRRPASCRRWSPRRCRRAWLRGSVWRTALP